MEKSNLAVGDLNRSKTTQPVRADHYESIIESHDRVELIELPTFIPHQTHIHEATTTPDSCVTDCEYDESVQLVHNSCLCSDHLAINFSSNFSLDIEQRQKTGYYYDYAALSELDVEKAWDECESNPGFKQIKEIFSKLLLKIKRKSSGIAKDKFEYDPDKNEHQSFNDFWVNNIQGNQNRMRNVGNMFRVLQRFEGTGDALNNVNKKRCVSRRKERAYFVDFKKSITSVERVSADQEAKYQRKMREARRNMEKYPQLLFTLDDYNTEFDAFKSNASPGPDRVSKSLFPKSPVNKSKLLWFINDSIFRLKLHPTLLQARLNFIDKIPKSVKKRPLCCGQRLLVLITRMAAARLEKVVNLDEFFQNRFGFRRQLGVEEFTGTLITKLMEWKKQGSYIGMLQTDISGAYTNVHHKKLVLAIYDLIERSAMPDSEKPWFLVLFTEDWLSNRVIFFRNTRVVMKRGVPQGDGYSPIAFIVYLAYECKDLDVLVFCYADDITILIRAPTAQKLLAKSAEIFADFENWCKSKNMKADPDKTKFMMLFRTEQTLLKVKHLFPSILDQNFVQNMRVLGIQFDTRLNFSAHVANVCNKMRIRINLLRKMKKVGQDIENALQFAVCVRASFHFGLWWTTMISECQWQKLEKCWNAVLRTAIHENTPKSTKLAVIREISGHTTIRDFCHYLMHLRTSKLADSTKIKRLF